MQLTQINKIPLGNTSITLFSQYEATDTIGDKPIKKTAWQKIIIPNCYHNIKVVLATSSDGIFVQQEKQVVKVPLFTEFRKSIDINDYDTQFTFKKNDLIIAREVVEEVTTHAELKEVSAKYDMIAFTIKNISYNYGEGIPLGHIQVGD